MSPFSEIGRNHRAVGDPLGVLLLAGAVLGGTLLTPPTAHAQAPAPPPELVAQVVDLEAPLLDLQLGTSDLRREARIEQLPRRTRITLDSTVLFSKDSARLNASAVVRLRSVNRQLKSRGPGKLQITGHTDDLGSAAHGLTLSRQRAEAVAKALRSNLPAADYPATTVGLGEQDPAVPNDSEAGRRINRRVVIVYDKR